MSIFLEVNGVVYENFTGATVEIRLDTLSNTFSFGAIAETGNLLPFKLGDSCKVRINNNLVLTGSIEIINVSYNQNSHNIAIQGRDRTGDLLDSTIDVFSDITPPISLKDAIQRTIDHLGLDLQVIDNFNAGEFNQAVSVLSPERGQNAFEFIEKLAREKQVLLTSNGDGNIVITRSTANRFQFGSLQNLLNNNLNNILSADVSYDNTGRYNRYVFASQLNPLATNQSTSTDSNTIINQEGFITDAEIRRGRQLVLVAESPFSANEDDARARWEANIRKARGRIYTAVVQGHTIQNRLWEINTLVNIVDVFAGINGQMLLNAITYNFDVDGGSTTVLQFVESNAYTLSLEEPRTDELGII